MVNIIEGGGTLGGGTSPPVVTDVPNNTTPLVNDDYERRIYQELVDRYAAIGLNLGKYITYDTFMSYVQAYGVQGALKVVRDSEALMYDDSGLANPAKPEGSPALIVTSKTLTGTGPASTNGSTVDPTLGGNTTTPTLPWGGDDTQGFWDEKPQATYQARLKMAGINPNTPYGKYQSENFYNAYLPYLLSSPTAWAGGGTPTSFGSSTPSTQVTPGMMTQAMGLSQDPTTPGGQVRGYLESEGMTNPLVSGMAQASGAPYALRQYMSGKAGDYRTDWESGGPSQVNTFMEYLNNLFGNRF